MFGRAPRLLLSVVFLIRRCLHCSFSWCFCASTVEVLDQNMSACICLRSREECVYICASQLCVNFLCACTRFQADIDVLRVQLRMRNYLSLIPHSSPGPDPFKQHSVFLGKSLHPSLPLHQFSFIFSVHSSRSLSSNYSGWREKQKGGERYRER